MVKNAKIIGIAVAVVAIAVFGLFADGLLLHKASAVSLPVGVTAPLKSFYFVNGTKGTLADFSGKTVLLYLVTTWCSTCAQGTSALGSNMSFFKSKNVSIVEVETYKDFNYSGEPIYQFTKQYAGNSSSYMVDAYSGYNLTATYDPKGYLDIYYLISPSGKIAYVNGEPSVTMDDLKAAINNLV